MLRRGSHFDRISRSNSNRDAYFNLFLERLTFSLVEVDSSVDAAPSLSTPNFFFSPLLLSPPDVLALSAVATSLTSIGSADFSMNWAFTVIGPSGGQIVLLTVPRF